MSSGPADPAPPDGASDPWYSAPPAPAQPPADIESTQAWRAEPEPVQSWSREPDAAQPWSAEPGRQSDGTQAWSPEPAQQSDGSQAWAPQPGQQSDATQAWTPEPAQQPDGPQPWAPQPGQQSDATQAWTPEPDATQAWNAGPAPSGPDSWSGPGDRQGQGTGPADSIVPDSWFSGPPQAPPQPEAPERWTPQPAPMNQDPWGPQQPADAPPAWGAQAPGGMAPMPQQETAMLASGYPPYDGHGHPPYDGHGHQPADEQGNRASKPLILAVAGLVAVALVAVALVMWPDGGKDPSAQRTPAAVQSTAKSANPAARQQAAAVNSLLNLSAASRGELGRALASAKRCKGLPNAIAGMQRVAQQRQQQVARAQTLKVNALSNGTQLRAHLAKSIQISLDVDRAYLAWAQRARGCKGRPKADANYQRGGQLSNQATVSKQRFATLWTPVAREQRLRPRTANQF
ncbi:hypothetical protein [Actinomadura sp. HBU206391]|uniref:hypothetical protein n=1 Tax=Actinomadura sp. HBU206391 TaxID=2731692 RepID=UPI0016501701|nr:hypothetical protein [Actinomadura sp. HBU206391]MBC6460341.1 hypothetical protein [Actinomadura sp. HBU206391]